MRRPSPFAITTHAHARPLLAIAVLATALAVPTMGAAAFTAPVDVSVAGRDADNPQIAVNADGLTSLGAWLRN